MANRAHKPTAESRQQAEMMSGVGVPQEDIALLLGVSLPTLHKHYRGDLDRGMAKANARVGQSLFQQAVNGNVTAAIYWTKARMGWTEKNVLDINVRNHEDALTELDSDPAPDAHWHEPEGAQTTH